MVVVVAVVVVLVVVVVVVPVVVSPNVMTPVDDLPSSRYSSSTPSVYSGRASRFWTQLWRASSQSVLVLGGIIDNLSSTSAFACFLSRILRSTECH